MLVLRMRFRLRMIGDKASMVPFFHTFTDEGMKCNNTQPKAKLHLGDFDKR